MERKSRHEFTNPFMEVLIGKTCPVIFIEEGFVTLYDKIGFEEYLKSYPDCDISETRKEFETEYQISENYSRFETIKYLLEFFLDYKDIEYQFRLY